MSDLNQQEIDGWKLVADRELAKFEASRGRLMEEHSAAFRWLMASLLALNGAGLLALKDVITTHRWEVIVAGLCFYLGCGCALMVAVFGQRASQAGIEFLSYLIAFWTTVRVTGEYSKDEHESCVSGQQLAIDQSKKSPRIGWLSFGLFSIGLLFLSLATSTHSVSKSKNHDTGNVPGKSRPVPPSKK